MKLKASLPKDELNGLTFVGQASQRLGSKFLVVGMVESISVTDELGKPSKDVKFSLERVEVVADEDLPYIAGMIENRFETRTGKSPLDIDVEGVEDLRRRYKPRTGKGRKGKAEPDMFAEPAALTPLKVDPATLHPDEVLDAEVVDDELGEPPLKDWEAADQAEQAGEDEPSAPEPEFSDR